jgi:uncharacterized protein involved in outer membrane biogenesis
MPHHATATNEATGPAPMNAARGRSRGRTIALRAALALAVLVLVAIVAHPWWLAPLVGSYLSETSGRAVHFDSLRVGLSATLAPVFHLRGVRIANAPWADTSRPFAVCDEAIFVFAWRRFEDRRVVALLVLRNGEVNLETGADGLRNWRLREPLDRGLGHYWFYALEPHATRLSFIHHGIDLHLQTAARDTPAQTSAAAPGEPLTMQIDFDGAYREVAFKGRVETGPVLSFLETERWFGVRGGAAIDGARLDVDGRTADIFRSPRFDAHVAVQGRSLAFLHPFVGRRYGAEARAFRGEGHLLADAEGYAVSGAEVRVGATDLAGDLAWSRGERKRRHVQARVHSGSTDLADLLWLAGEPAAATQKAPATVAAPASSSSASASRDVFAAARDLDADLSFEAQRFHVAAFALVQSLRLKADLAGGQLAVSDLDLGWAGGHSIGRLGLDLRQPLASADARIETYGVRAEALLGKVDENKRITGTLSGALAFKAKGNDAMALRSSVTGTAHVTLLNGTIPSLLDAEMGLEGGKLLRTLASGNEPLALPCAAATFDLLEGRARLRNLVIDSANTRTTGSGTIDLRDESVDLLLTPEPKRPGVFELRRSIHLFGRLPKPERKLVERVEIPAGTACADKP